MIFPETKRFKCSVLRVSSASLSDALVVLIGELAESGSYLIYDITVTQDEQTCWHVTVYMT